MIQGRSSGRQQDIAFGALAADLQKASFHFGAMVAQAGLLKGAFDQFRELQKQLQLTNSVAQGTTEEFKKMEDSVRNFALASTFSAAEAASALYFLASAGFSVEESMSAMTGVLTLAQATLNDVGETSDLVASSIRAFGLRADEASRVANVMTATITGSQATLNKLAFAFRQVAPVAGAAGISIENVNAALGQLFNIGLRGEQAGTALRNILVGLTNPAGEAKDILQTLGIQVTQADGKLRDFFSILKEIGSKNLIQSDLAKLFGKEAVAGAIALLDAASSGKLDKFNESVTGTERALSVALQQLDTLDGSVKIFNNSITELGISLGSSLESPLRTFLDFGSNLVIAFRDLDSGTKDLSIRLVSLAATLFVVAKGFKLIFKVSLLEAAMLFGSRGVAAGFVAMKAPMDAATASMFGFAKETKVAQTAVTRWGITIGRVFGGILSLGLIAGSLFLLGKSFKDAGNAAARASLDDRFGAIPNVIDKLSVSIDRANRINKDTTGARKVGILSGQLFQLREAIAASTKDFEEILGLKKDLVAKRNEVNDLAISTNFNRGDSIDEFIQSLVNTGISKGLIDKITTIADREKSKGKSLTRKIFGLGDVVKEIGDGISDEIDAVNTRLIKSRESRRKGIAIFDKAVATFEEDLPTTLRAITSKIRNGKQGELQDAVTKFLDAASGQGQKALQDIVLKQINNESPSLTVDGIVGLLAKSIAGLSDKLLAEATALRLPTLLAKNLKPLENIIAQKRLQALKTLVSIAATPENKKLLLEAESEAAAKSSALAFSKSAKTAIDNILGGLGADPSIVALFSGADLLGPVFDDLQDKVLASKEEFSSFVRGRMSELLANRLDIVGSKDISDKEKVRRKEDLVKQFKALADISLPEGPLTDVLFRALKATKANLDASALKSDKDLRILAFNQSTRSKNIEFELIRSLPFANAERIAALSPQNAGAQLRVQLESIRLKTDKIIRNAEQLFNARKKRGEVVNFATEKSQLDRRIALLKEGANLETDAALRESGLARDARLRDIANNSRTIGEALRKGRLEIRRISLELAGQGGLNVSDIIGNNVAEIKNTALTELARLKGEFESKRAEFGTLIQFPTESLVGFQGRQAKQASDLALVTKEYENRVDVLRKVRDARLKLATSVEKIATITRQSNIDIARANLRNLEASGTFLQGVEAQAKLLSDQVTTAAQDGAEAVKGLSNAMRDSFSSALFDTETSLRESLSRMLNQFARFAFDVATKGIFEQASSGILTKVLPTFGLSTASIPHAAKGMILDRPAILAGEAGTEAVLPLTRTSNGDLGVKSLGGSGKNVQFNTSISVSVPASSGGGGGGNGQNAEQVGRQISELVNVAFNKNLQNEMRPGGLLSGFAR